VLQSMDWSIRVGVLIVELDRSNPSKDERVRALLRANGFRFVRRMGFRSSSDLWEGFLSSEVDASGRHLRHGHWTERHHP
jgi:hypothetical protein